MATFALGMAAPSESVMMPEMVVVVWAKGRDGEGRGDEAEDRNALREGHFGLQDVNTYEVRAQLCTYDERLMNERCIRAGDVRFTGLWYIHGLQGRYLCD